jgi:GNAT superfamily N-acetyltransferase
MIEFTRRPHREGEDAALLDLLNAAFGRWPAVEIQVDPVDHLRWKLSGIEDSAQLHRITEVEGHIASSTFCIVQNILVRGGSLRSIQASDSCVHPDYQRRGLAEAIRIWRRENPDEQPCDMQFGVQSPHPALQRIGRRMQKGTQPIANAIQSLARAPLQASEPPPSDSAVDWTIVPADRFDDRIDAFWMQAARPFDFIIARKREYLNWRYADPRAGIFAIRLAEQDGALLGYSVLRISNDKAFFADLLVLPGRLDVVRSLIADGLSYFRPSGTVRAGVSRIDCWLPARHPYNEALHDVGFAFRKHPTIVQLAPRRKDVAAAVSFLADPYAAVHITAGDTDLV